MPHFNFSSFSVEINLIFYYLCLYVLEQRPPNPLLFLLLFPLKTITDNSGIFFPFAPSLYYYNIKRKNGLRRSFEYWNFCTWIQCYCPPCPTIIARLHLVYNRRFRTHLHWSFKGLTASQRLQMWRQGRGYIKVSDALFISYIFVNYITNY